MVPCHNVSNHLSVDRIQHPTTHLIFTQVLVFERHIAAARQLGSAAFDEMCDAQRAINTLRNRIYSQKAQVQDLLPMFRETETCDVSLETAIFRQRYTGAYTNSIE